MPCVCMSLKILSPLFWKAQFSVYVVVVCNSSHLKKIILILYCRFIFYIFIFIYILYLFILLIMFCFHDIHKIISLAITASKSFSSSGKSSPQRSRKSQNLIYNKVNNIKIKSNFALDTRNVPIFNIVKFTIKFYILCCLFVWYITACNSESFFL